MPNLSQKKRDRMLTFLKMLKDENKTNDEVLIAIGEIESELTSKKYGLVWEEHQENVDLQLLDNIPVFSEVPEKEISAIKNGDYNFLLEGDNLHSLYLLEKTYTEGIDVIYIDPPYNTLNQFVYDDNRVGDDDTFKHSKWLSFMKKRLTIAYNLLKDDGIIMVSIDDKEQASLKLLMDEIFDEDNRISTHHVQVRYAEKSLTDGKQVKPVMEYIYIYAKSINKCSLNLPKEKYTDESFIYEIKELNDGSHYFIDGQEVVVFKKGEWSIEKKEKPNISLLKETWISGTIYSKMSYGQVVKKYIEPRYSTDGTGCLYKLIGRGDDGLGYRYYIGPERKGATRCKMYSGMPLDRVEQIKSGNGAYRDVPISNLMNFAPDFGNIVNEGGVPFNSGKKPIKMLKELINYHPNKNAIVLDFFAGSASTGHAVLSLNQDDGGNRHFILCTNNENKICENITFPRLNNVINGWGNNKGMPANLMYYKTDFVAKDDEYIVNSLLNHIKEMIQLEYRIKVDNIKYKIILSDEDADILEKDWSQCNAEHIFISRDVLLTSSQKKLFDKVNISIIPDNYFNFELKELGESW